MSKAGKAGETTASSALSLAGCHAEFSHPTLWHTDQPLPRYTATVPRPP